MAAMGAASVTKAPAEAAKAIAWFALENEYVSGKVIPVNGGV